ncbi:MAG: hypothetical protein ACREJC_20330 [Tepidisphaeraceae bacterium]
MPVRRSCELCDAILPPHGFYLVRIDVLAEPSIPETTADELEEIDFDEVFSKLIEQMRAMSADELQDDVHRRFEFTLCRKCQKKFLVNPLGKPRTRTQGEN